MGEYICPYCFAKVDTNDIWFQCMNHECTSPDTNRTAFIYGVPLSQVNDFNAERFPNVFGARSPGSFARMFGAKAPRSAPCDQCGQESSIRVCPECHSPFPHGIGSLSNLVIAIVGAKETGKSHYIAVLIQRIRALYKSFGWTLGALDDETMRLYNEHFYNPLYRARKTLEITKSANAVDSTARKPLLYSLSVSRDNKTKIVTLAFFDAAGEDMDDESRMRTINRYIYNAAGIIILLDPLQLPKVRERLCDEENLPQQNTYSGEIINRVDNLIRVCRNIPLSRKVPIPLAVVFSKVDMLRGIMGDSSPVFQESRHRGIFDLREFKSGSEHIRDWIDELDPQCAFVQQAYDFSDYGFFGVSALGGNADRDGNLPFEPRPIRVEDPFLWILWKNGIIEGKE